MPRMTANGLLLEAKAMREHAQRLLESAARFEAEAEEGRVVRVTFSEGGRQYCYLLPRVLGVAIGDELAVPPSEWHRKRGPGSQLVTVVGFGRNGYDGPLETARGRVVGF